ncbi:MAG: glycosyltransferase family 39 protein [Anaerolineae bacterium]
MRAAEWWRRAGATAARAWQDRRLFVGFVMGLALALRLIGLGFQPLWWDEGWSLYFAASDLPSLAAQTAVDIHPPLYYLLLHGWIAAWGPGVISVRLLSVLIGVATVPLLYRVGARCIGERGGRWAALLLAVSPFHIYYSQEVRMYGLVTLLGLAATAWGLGWSLRARRGLWRQWLGYVLAATAALYTQYYAAFLLLALNAGVGLRWLGLMAAPEDWGNGRQPLPIQGLGSPSSTGSRSLGKWVLRPLAGLGWWLSAQAAVFLLFLPWLIYAGGRLLTYVRFKVGIEQDQPWGFFLYLGRHLAAFVWGHAEGPLAAWWWVGLAPLGVLVVIAIALGLRRRFGPGAGRIDLAPALWLWLAPLGCGFGVNLVFPFHPLRGERLFLLVLPAALIVVAGLLEMLWRVRPWLVGAPAALWGMAVLASLAALYTVPRYAEDDYRPVADRLRALSRPGDAVICVHPWQVGYLIAYLPEAERRPSLILTPRQMLPREQQLWAEDPRRMAEELTALLSRHGRLWLPAHQAMGRVMEEPIEAYLTAHAYPALSEWYGPHTLLSMFADGVTEEQEVSARFGEWLSLEGAALSPGPLEAGYGVVAVGLTWKLLERPDAPYTVGLRLVDPTGRVWAQRDQPPCGGLEPFDRWPTSEPGLDRHGLLVPAGTPPGEYRVTARVYHSQDLTVVPATFAGGGGGEVTLGMVRVVRPHIPPPREALPPVEPLRATGGPLRLWGYWVGPDRLRPGETVEVKLVWQARLDPGEDFLPELRLIDPQGETQVVWTEKPVAGLYPTAWWRAGEWVVDPHSVPIPAAAAAGSYRLVLRLIRAADGQPVEWERGQTSMELGAIEVTGRAHRYEPTTPQYFQWGKLGSPVELIGYDLSETDPVPGSTVEVRLHWHAVQTPDRNYWAFVHLLDADGAIVAQHDGPPGQGDLPTLGWLPGEYLTDPHELFLPSDLPQGEYRLEAGLYDPSTQQRLGEPIRLETRVRVRRVAPT